MLLKVSLIVFFSKSTYQVRSINASRLPYSLSMFFRILNLDYSGKYFV